MCCRPKQKGGMWVGYRSFAAGRLWKMCQFLAKLLVKNAKRSSFWLKIKSRPKKEKSSLRFVPIIGRNLSEDYKKEK